MTAGLLQLPQIAKLPRVATAGGLYLHKPREVCGSCPRLAGLWQLGLPQEAPRQGADATI